VTQPILTQKLKRDITHCLTQFEHLEAFQKTLYVTQFCFVPTANQQFHLRYHTDGQHGLTLDLGKAINCLADLVRCINQNVGINDS